MTEDNNYRPRSPDLSSLQFPPSTAPPDQYAPLTSPLAHRASYDASPFFSSNYQRPTSASRTPQQYVPPVPLTGFDPDMARRSSRLATTDGAPVAAVPEPFHTPYAIEPVAAPIMPEQRHPQPGAGIEVKTKFPVARIKRIMQADEDVGKVAQVTPIAVSKALELFMISLVTKAAHEAKERNSKRVTAWHLKHAVAKDEVLDFLADIIAKVPDQPAGRKHEDDGSDQNEGRRKRGGRRPKEESD